MQFHLGHIQLDGNLVVMVQHLLKFVDYIQMNVNVIGYQHHQKHGIQHGFNMISKVYSYLHYVL